MNQGDDPYKILDVDSTASASEIKKSYRKLALKYHPDKNPNDAQASAMFAKVANAYEILSDDERRNQYDMRQRCGANGFDNNACYENPGTTSSSSSGISSNPKRRTTSTRTNTTSSSAPYTKYYSNTPIQTQTSRTTYATSKTAKPTNTFQSIRVTKMSTNEPVTVTFTGTIPDELMAKFRDPEELFKSMFSEEYGHDPDFLKEAPQIKIVHTPSATKRCSMSKGFSPTITPTRNTAKQKNSFSMSARHPPSIDSTSKSTYTSGMKNTNEQQSMSSSTRQVMLPDGSVETITETTVTYSDGRTETRRESSIQSSSCQPDRHSSQLRSSNMRAPSTNHVMLSLSSSDPRKEKGSDDPSTQSFRRVVKQYS